VVLMSTADGRKYACELPENVVPAAPKNQTEEAATEKADDKQSSHDELSKLPSPSPPSGRREQARTVTSTKFGDGRKAWRPRLAPATRALRPPPPRVAPYLLSGVHADTV
jgi:hypothetical protein